jgi:hypothetical protein
VLYGNRRRVARERGSAPVARRGLFQAGSHSSPPPLPAAAGPKCRRRMQGATTVPPPPRADNRHALEWGPRRHPEPLRRLRRPSTIGRQERRRWSCRQDVEQERRTRTGDLRVTDIQLWRTTAERAYRQCMRARSVTRVLMARLATGPCHMPNHPCQPANFTTDQQRPLCRCVPSAERPLWRWPVAEGMERSRLSAG